MSFLALLAALALQTSDLDRIQELLEAARENPESASTHHELGVLYAALGRPAEAELELGRAVELSEEPTYALDYGEILYQTGRPEAARPHLESAAALPEALLLLAAVHEKVGDEEAAFAALTRYVELKRDDVSSRLLLGRKLEQAHRMDEALAVYRGGVSAESPNAALLSRVADIGSRSRETYDVAEDAARRALEADPGLLEPRLALARVLARTGRDGDALVALEQARERHPGSAEVHYALSQSYQRAGRAEDARVAMGKFQELSGSDKAASEREARVAATYKRAAELLRTGSMLEAETVFRSVLEIDPEQAQTRSMLAKIAFSKSDVPAAIVWIDEAISRDRSVSEYHYLRALFLARARRPVEAEASVRRALEMNPGSPEAWSLLGSLLLDTGRASESIACFSRAGALEPSSASVQLNLASAHAALGNREEEEKAMERYRRLSQR
jgi:tetratricopeptide (TPR) repeat protein